MKNKILYIGRFMFPDLNAAANRVLGIGKILAELGYEVVFAGSNETCRAIDRGEDGFYRYKGFVYFSRARMSSKDFYFNWDYFLKTADVIGVENIKYIISYHLSALASPGLIKWCDKNGIILIADCTEWYELNTNTKMWYIDSELRMRIIHPRIGNMIAISSYLENYYNHKGCETVKIPVVSSEPAIVKTINAGRETTFCYCGNPGKKDLLPDIIEAFIRLYAKSQDFKFEVVGITKEQFMDYYALDANLSDIIDRFSTFHGFIPQSDAQQIVSSSDFSILLRHNKRYAMAGFPTKFTESMFCGTPMIANITGDIGEYLEDGVNGFVVEDDSCESLLAVIEKACNSNVEDRIKMMRGCVECANTKLYYKRYVDLLREFLVKLEK